MGHCIFLLIIRPFRLKRGHIHFKILVRRRLFTLAGFSTNMPPLCGWISLLPALWPKNHIWLPCYLVHIQPHSGGILVEKQSIQRSVCEQIFKDERRWVSDGRSKYWKMRNLLFFMLGKSWHRWRLSAAKNILDGHRLYCPQIHTNGHK